MKKTITVLISSLLFTMLPGVVNATSSSNIYTNSNGVTMPMEMYNNLRKLHSEKYLEVLTSDEYNRLVNLDIDFDTVQRSEKYIKTEYNNVTRTITHTELTEEEYNQIDVSSYIEHPRATVIETQYKKLSLGAGKTSDDTAYSTLSAIWKMSPSTRSFDVNAQRFQNLEHINGTQQGKQIYTLNGTTNYIQYNWNGTNIKNFDDGFGISMNLVDADVTYLESETDTSSFITSFPCVIRAAYEHATQNVTLTQSQYYYLGPGGQGNVIIFYNNMHNKYDGMAGVFQYFTS